MRHSKRYMHASPARSRTRTARVRHPYHLIREIRPARIVCAPGPRRYAKALRAWKRCGRGVIRGSFATELCADKCVPKLPRWPRLGAPGEFGNEGGEIGRRRFRRGGTVATGESGSGYSTVTLLARLRGSSTSRPTAPPCGRRAVTPGDRQRT